MDKIRAALKLIWDAITSLISNLVFLFGKGPANIEIYSFRVRGPEKDYIFQEFKSRRDWIAKDIHNKYGKVQTNLIDKSNEQKQQA